MIDIAREYRRMADTGLAFRGLSLLQHAEAVGTLIAATGSKTLLDWGAGAGDAYRPPHDLHKRWRVGRPTLYDPAFPKHARRAKGQFDGVICTDVLEHIPDADTDHVVRQLFGHARRFMFASVCCRPAGKTFSNGQNLHITLQPMTWWREKLERLAPAGLRWELVETP